jgi:catechol 2,3-dioxygenase-like lactoylglutathione lyase family enzyme
MNNRGAFVRIIVSNIEQSIKFYTETLGFIVVQKPSSESAVIEPPLNAQFRPRISLTTAFYIGQNPGNCQSLSVGILLDSEEAFDIAVKELKEKGVKFTTDIISEGLSVFVFFVDPDNNPLYIGANRQLSA